MRSYLISLCQKKTGEGGRKERCKGLAPAQGEATAGALFLPITIINKRGQASPLSWLKAIVLCRASFSPLPLPPPLKARMGKTACLQGEGVGCQLSHLDRWERWAPQTWMHPCPCPTFWPRLSLPKLYKPQRCPSNCRSLLASLLPPLPTVSFQQLSVILLKQPREALPLLTPSVAPIGLLETWAPHHLSPLAALVKNSRNTPTSGPLHLLSLCLECSPS